MVQALYLIRDVESLNTVEEKAEVDAKKAELDLKLNS